MRKKKCKPHEMSRKFYDWKKREKDFLNGSMGMRVKLGVSFGVAKSMKWRERDRRVICYLMIIF